MIKPELFFLGGGVIFGKAPLTLEQMPIKYLFIVNLKKIYVSHFHS